MNFILLKVVINSVCAILILDEYLVKGDFLAQLKKKTEKERNQC